MRKLSANFIYPGNSEPVKDGLIIVEGSGEITGILQPTDMDFPSDGIEYFDGILCPGFINTHCHLELSFLKGRISKGTGLPKFLKEVTQLREAPEEEILESIERAEKEMIEAGIVAVGDISNGTNSFGQKAKSSLLYHTFFELIGFTPERAELVYQKGLDLLDDYYKLEAEYPGFKAYASLCPHAPYTVSGRLLKLIGNSCYARDGIISIHNQESEDENLLYQLGSGKFKDLLESFSIDTSHWKPTGFNSLPSVLSQFQKCNKILLVHNTFTSEKDIQWAREYSNMLWWCLCPKANLYIENRLPDIDTFRKNNCRITIGTDSLSSNDTLSVLEELKAISLHFPHIPLKEQIAWATFNGAKLLGFDTLGSLEKGKRPGINLIDGLAGEQPALTALSKVKKLV
jgi:aminodeoxyfutalosine deaminase